MELPGVGRFSAMWRYYMPQADLSRSFRSCLEAIHSLNLFLRHALRSLLQSQVADKRKSRFPVWQTFPMLQEVDTVQSTFLRRRCSKIFHADSLRPAWANESAKAKASSTAIAPPCPRFGVVACAASPISPMRPEDHFGSGFNR